MQAWLAQHLSKPKTKETTRSGSKSRVRIAKRPGLRGNRITWPPDTFGGSGIICRPRVFERSFWQVRQDHHEHVQNVFAEKELDEKATIRNFRIVRQEGARQVTRDVEHCSLDVIISVGYRVKSQQGTRFRIWATRTLKEHLVKGYTINQRRLAERRACSAAGKPGAMGGWRSGLADCEIQGGASAVFRHQGPPAVRWKQARRLLTVSLLSGTESRTPARGRNA